jgi:glycosyltransferase involved in cell wall biosynthesis
MRIVFWENIVSQHKMPYWKHLVSHEKVSKFVLVTQEVLSDDLKRQGWEHHWNELEGFEIIVNPEPNHIEQLFTTEKTDSYHIFSGIKAFPMVFGALQSSLNYDVNRILLTETVNLNGLRVITRRLASIVIERAHLKHYDLILGSGSTTKQWYLECGVKAKNFYPFMYTVNQPENTTPIDGQSGVMKFVFIGQLVERKGLDILLKALSQIKSQNWTLDIYGDGADKETYVNLCQSLSLDSKVTFKGIVENNKLQKRIGVYHTLVLPSRFDGWGAVVNEAIASGLRVICSSKCGASILLKDKRIGDVYTTDAQLTKSLEHSIINLSNFDRDHVLAYNEYLTGNSVADYLVDIIEHHFKNIGPRPIAPWDRFVLDQKNNLK